MLKFCQKLNKKGYISTRIENEKLENNYQTMKNEINSKPVILQKIKNLKSSVNVNSIKLKNAALENKFKTALKGKFEENNKTIIRIQNLIKISRIKNEKRNKIFGNKVFL